MAKAHVAFGKVSKKYRYDLVSARARGELDLYFLFPKISRTFPQFLFSLFHNCFVPFLHFFKSTFSQNTDTKWLCLQFSLSFFEITEVLGFGLYNSAIPSLSVVTDILQVFEVLHRYNISPFFIQSIRFSAKDAIYNNDCLTTICIRVCHFDENCI